MKALVLGLRVLWTVLAFWALVRAGLALVGANEDSPEAFVLWMVAAFVFMHVEEGIER